MKTKEHIGRQNKEPMWYVHAKESLILDIESVVRVASWLYRAFLHLEITGFVVILSCLSTISSRTYYSVHDIYCAPSIIYYFWFYVRIRTVVKSITMTIFQINNMYDTNVLQILSGFSFLPFPSEISVSSRIGKHVQIYRITNWIYVAGFGIKLTYTYLQASSVSNNLNNSHPVVAGI